MNTISDDLNLQQYWQVLKRRWLPASGVFVLISGLFAASTLVEDPVYRARGSLLIKSSRAPSLAGLDQDLGNLDPLSYRGNPLETQAQIVRSTSIAQSVIQDLGLKDEDGELWSPTALLQGLEVSAVSETADILNVQYSSEDPELATEIVNQVMEEYLAYNLQDNRAEASSTREFIETRLPRAEADMRRAVNSLRQFKESNQIVALEEEAVAVVDILKDIDQRILATQAELADISEKTSELSAQLGMNARQSILSTSLGQFPGIEEILTELQGVQSELATERTRYRDIHPTVAGLERQEAALRDLLQQRVNEVVGSDIQIQPGQIQFGELQQTLTESLVNLETERTGLVRQLEQLNLAQNAYQSRASVFPELEETQRLLEQRLDDAVNNYEDLLNRLQEVQIAENQNLANAQIVQSALVPTAPISNYSNLIRFAGVICGLLMGVAVAFILDLLDRSIKTVPDAQKLLQYPLLAQIPEISIQDGARSIAVATANQHPQIPVLENPYSSFSKAYQTLQVNLKGLGVRSLVLSSTSAGEGTSTVAANLAAAFSQSQQKILLIDGDLASPRQHELWNISNSFGLSELIQASGTDSKKILWKDAVTQVASNLSIIPAGTTPVNPIGAFDSESMEILMQEICSSYDLVIVDTAPINSCADGVLLERLVDGLIMVVNPRKANIDDLEAARDLLLHPNSNVIGFVANQVKQNQVTASSSPTLLQRTSSNTQPFIFHQTESLGERKS